MKLTQSKEANINYLAKVVQINCFRSHSNPEVTKLKCCTIDGFNIITGINESPGIYVYFPTSCCLNPDFLRYNNLYQDKELNNNSEKSGMFEESGRVKTIKLKQELSEGFIIPFVEFQDYIISVTNKKIDAEIGIEFDSIEHEGKSFWINKKYLPKKPANTPGNPGRSKERYKVNKGLSKVIDTQFRFHYSTVILKKCPYVIHPKDLISITAKIHGTSGVSAYVLCRQNLNWKLKLVKWLSGEEFNKYDYLYSSRSVIKNEFYNKNVTSGFYGCDVWAEADKIVKPCLTKGMTAYYEIVGFLPNGKYIQNGFDYGCTPPVGIELYTHEKHFKVRVYRVTITNIDGIVHEFSGLEVQQWCNKIGLVPVEEYFYDLAGNLYPDLDVNNHWTENFMERLANDKKFYMECNSPLCTNKVPHEGIVIKIENMKSEAFKLKCFNFLDKEGKALDKGEENMEDNS